MPPAISDQLCSCATQHLPIVIVPSQETIEFSSLFERAIGVDIAAQVSVGVVAEGLIDVSDVSPIVHQETASVSDEPYRTEPDVNAALIVLFSTLNVLPQVTSIELPIISDQQSATSNQGSAVSSQPPAPSESPSAVSSAPSAVSLPPSAFSAQSSVVSIQHSAFSPQPSAVTHPPSVSIQPAAVSEQLSAISAQPSASGELPSVFSPQSSVSNAQRSTADEPPSAVSSAPSAVSLQPSAISAQPSASSEQPAAVSLQPSVAPTQRSALSGQLSAVGEQPSAISDQSSVFNAQPLPPSELPSVVSLQPSVSSLQSSAISSQPSAAVLGAEVALESEGLSERIHVGRSDGDRAVAQPDLSRHDMPSDARQDRDASDSESRNRVLERSLSPPDDWRQHGSDLALAAPQAGGDIRTTSAAPSGYRGSPVDQVAEQLAAWARLHPRHERGIVQVRLHPQALGELMIEVSWQDSGIVAAIKAQNTVAGELLASDLNRLRTTLTEQGIPVFDLGVQIGMDLHQRHFDGYGFLAAPRIDSIPESDFRRDRESVLPILHALRSNSMIDILV